MEKKTYIGTIDCTPTWESLVSSFVVLLEHGTPEGKSIAKQELIKMAKLADAYVEMRKQK